MKFISLSIAAKKLNTSVNGLIGLAAKKRTVISVAIPPDINIWRIESPLPDSKGQVMISKAPVFSHINIGKDNCRDLLTNQVTPKLPIYCSGYLKSPKGPIRYNPIKDWATPKTLNKIQEYRWIMLPGYHAIHLVDGNLIALKEGYSEHSTIGQEPLDTQPVTNTTMPTNSAGEIVVLKQARMVQLEITPESLLIAVETLNLLRDELTQCLPPDEMKDSTYASSYMQDMNQIAKEMFVLAMRKKNIYPKPDVIKERLMEMPSFKLWGQERTNASKKQTDSTTGFYADLPDTAVAIIRPKAAQGKGEKKIDPSEGYLSDKFETLIKASNEFGPKFQDAIKPSIDGVTQWLLESNLGKEISGRAAPLIWPYQERNPGRRLGVQNSK